MFPSFDQSRAVMAPVNYSVPPVVRPPSPEFSGNFEEDPREFLDQVEDLLFQSGINRDLWVRTGVQFLKGTALTWWETIKLNNMSWRQFARELLTAFDNNSIQAELEIELMTTQQQPNQRMTEFIIAKQRLAMRARPSCSEQQIVDRVVSLLRNEYYTVTSECAVRER